MFFWDQFYDIHIVTSSHKHNVINLTTQFKLFNDKMLISIIMSKYPDFCRISLPGNSRAQSYHGTMSLHRHSKTIDISQLL